MPTLTFIPRKRIPTKQSPTQGARYYDRDSLLEIGIKEYVLSSLEWRLRTDLPCLEVVSDRFGSWRKFKESIDEVIDKDEISVPGDRDLEIKCMNLLKRLPPSIKQKYDQLNPYERRRFLLSLKETPAILDSPRINFYPIVGKSKGRRLLIDLNTIIISRFLLEQYVKWIWDDPIAFLFWGSNQLSVFVNKCDPYTGEYKKGKNGPYHNFYELRYRLSDKYKPLSLLELMSIDVDETLVRKAKKIDEGSRLIEFCLEKYIEYYWDNPEGDGRGMSITSCRFINNRDPISNKFLGVEKGRLANRIYEGNYLRFRKKGEGFLEYLKRKDINQELITKAESLDNGTRLREYLVQSYVELFWNDPFLIGGHQGPIIRKTLRGYICSRDHKTGRYLGTSNNGTRIKKAYYKTAKKKGFNFFDYVTQGLNPELVEKARLIDSGERANQLLVERIEAHNQLLEGYTNEN